MLVGVILSNFQAGLILRGLIAREIPNDIKGADDNGSKKAVRSVYRMSNKVPHADLLPGSDHAGL